MPHDYRLEDTRHNARGQQRRRGQRPQPGAADADLERQRQRAIGLYRVQPDPRPHIDDIVVVRPPSDLVWFLAEGGYLPRGVPLLKHVAALGGQRVCRTGRAVSIDGEHVGDALERDHRGRPLPAFQGCVVLTDAQVFLFNADRADSLDGRYFGPLERTTIVGRASPIWTHEER